MGRNFVDEESGQLNHATQRNATRDPT